MPTLSNELVRDGRERLVRMLGRGPLDQQTINALGRQLFKGEWGGCWAADELPRGVLADNGKHFYILNSGGARNGGIHWLAIAAPAPRAGAPPEAYLYDSFGRRVSHLTRQSIAALRASGRALFEGNVTRDQVGRSALCGHDSLAWCLGVRAVGLAGMLETAAPRPV